MTYRSIVHHTLPIAAIAAVVAALTVGPTPGVNESHYFTKARRFWDPNWCVGDLFLDSADAHWLFYAAFGWPTQWMSLDDVAWMGRIVCWGLVAWSWWRLARRLEVGLVRAALAAGLAVVVNRYGNFAGEWFVGGCEAKVIAYALVFFAVERAAAGRWGHVWLALGLATALHAVVGLWAFAAVSAAGVVQYLGHKVPRSRHELSGRRDGLPVQPIRGNAGPLLAGCVAIGLACLGIIPALAINWQTNTQVMAEANRIQVLDRLAYHQWLFAFPVTRILRFCLVVGAWALVVRATRRQPPLRIVHATAGAAMCISIAGAGLTAVARLGIAEDTALALLRFYWFRLADVMIPVSIALGVAVWSRHVQGDGGPRDRGTAFWLIVMAACVAGGLALHVVGFLRDSRPAADRQSLPAFVDDARRTWETMEHWRATCRWIAMHTPDDALFITPRDQQTFKWYAQRAEVVTWKDAPQDAASLVEWRMRMMDVHGGNDEQFGVLTRPDSELAELARRYGAAYLVVEQRHVDARLATGYPVSFPQLYPSSAHERSTYVVFRVEPDTAKAK